MKKLILLAGAAAVLTLAVSTAQASVASFETLSGIKKPGFVTVTDDGMFEKRGRKQKRKHTGLDDGPNHD